MKSVQFDCTLNKIGYTYSASEYDRSHFVIPPSPNRAFDLSLILPSSPSSPSPPASPSSPLSLSSSPSSPSPLTFSSPTSSSSSSSPAEAALCSRRPYIAPLDFSSIPNQCKRESSNDHTQQKGGKPPKLIINTEMASGPLFFTHLSTHYKCRLEDEFDDDGNNPMMIMSRLKNLNSSSLESY
ncbi:unnamed protein product [Absidia cylindrospora]